MSTGGLVIATRIYGDRCAEGVGLVLQQCEILKAGWEDTKLMILTDGRSERVVIDSLGRFSETTDVFVMDMSKFDRPINKMFGEARKLDYGLCILSSTVEVTTEVGVKVQDLWNKGLEVVGFEISGMGNNGIQPGFTIYNTCAFYSRVAVKNTAALP